MADKSSIEWTDATWNPVTGCSRVSRGCENCYAERLAATRLRNHPSRQGLADSNGRWNGRIHFNSEWLAQPLRWQRPRKVFVAAHGDLFHSNVSTRMLDEIFAVMALAPQHVFQVLTKRPERMRGYLLGDRAASRIHEVVYGWLLHDKPGPEGFRFSRQDRWDCARRADRWQPQFSWPLPNVWPGVSVEDQPTADERTRYLLETPAAVRWLSLEPLLGPIDLRRLAPQWLRPTKVDALAGTRYYDDSRVQGAALDWVVVGGESGPRARLMDPAWARSLRDQCICAEVPFFFKQWGGRTSKAGGAVLDGREWRQFPHAA